MKLYNNFSLWVAAVVTLWWFGVLKFSPLFLVLTNLLWVTAFASREYDFHFSWIALILILAHAKPILLFDIHAPMDLVPSLTVFAMYNLFLLAQGTNMVQAYSERYKDKPQTLKQFIEQA